MILDVYNHFKEDPSYNKLIGNDFLILEYKCPIMVEQFQLWMESHFLSYVISGKKDWHSGNDTYTVEGGEALFIKKGVYSTKQYFEEDYCVILFFMTDDFIKNFLTENDSLKPPSDTAELDNQIFEVDVNESLKSLMLSVFNYFKQGNKLPKKLVELKFRELLYNLLLNPHNRNISSFFHSISQSEKTSIEYVMAQNFQYDLKMEEFARLSGRSLSTFKRDFKNHFNESPGKWLTNKRLEYATTLLKASDLNISQVGYESGFKNSSHFNKLFKEKYEVPPKKFRALQLSS